MGEVDYKRFESCKFMADSPDDRLARLMLIQEVMDSYARHLYDDHYVAPVMADFYSEMKSAMQCEFSVRREGGM